MTASLPRPVLMAMIGAVLFAGVFMFTRSRSGSETSAAPAPAQTNAPVVKPGEATRPAQTAATPQRAAGHSNSSDKGLPGPVRRAIDAKKVVVLLFWNPRAVDDRSVHSAVKRLSDHGGKVAVFTDRTKNLSRYTRITAAASVTQTPSIVIVDKRGAAEVETGFLDFQTIDRYVESAVTR